MNQPLYIFDLDGTVADIAHRRHLLLDKTDGQRWRKFYAECVRDVPNAPVVNTLHMLKRSGADVWIWSGRSDEVREQTEVWLRAIIHYPAVVDSLRMRKEHDYTPDDVLKRIWLDSLSDLDRARLVATFDDRDRVVNMWRSEGIPCFQVADGDF